MKCKIISDSTAIGLQARMNEFLKTVVIVKHVSYTTYKDGYTPCYSAMIIYE